MLYTLKTKLLHISIFQNQPHHLFHIIYHLYINGPKSPSLGPKWWTPRLESPLPFCYSQHPKRTLIDLGLLLPSDASTHSIPIL